jgi:hypothetical protein
MQSCLQHMSIFFLSKQQVDFFQAQSLGLLDAKIDKGDGQQIEDTEEEVKLPAYIGDARRAKFDNLVLIRTRTLGIVPKPQ